MTVEGPVVRNLILPGAFLIVPKEFHDPRGAFFKTYTRELFESRGLSMRFSEEYFSISGRGVVRGLHYQAGESAQAKLVTCARGEIFDVIVDLRGDSPTYGRWMSNVLSEKNRHSLYIPRGFAHGYMALTDDATVFYKADNDYHPEAERGIRWDDKALAISWPEVSPPVLSKKDMSWPPFIPARKRG